MIERYTRPEMGRVWSRQRKLEAWLEVELAACRAWAEAGVLPREDLDAILSKARFDIDDVDRREAVTHHDVAAFVDVVSASVGEPGRWIHYGLTSSDVLDTALALQLREAGALILSEASRLVCALVERARQSADIACVGRTHGVHAEPTSFGLRLAGFAFEADRNRERLGRAFAQVQVGKLSGAVGTYSATGPQIEAAVMDSLGLKPEAVATQVVPRDRHADLMTAIALAGAGLERLANDVRHLQRTEVREVEEPFAAGQKGSSAMPHKRNPIICERICGLSRILRANAQAALENVALLHERDISHSSVERVILPDSTILLHYMLQLATRVVEQMTVYEDRMRRNLDLTSGALFSQRALTALVEAGMARDDAYRIVQSTANRAWSEGRPLLDLLLDEPQAKAILGAERIARIFDSDTFLRHLPKVLSRLDNICVGGSDSSRPE